MMAARRRTGFPRLPVILAALIGTVALIVVLAAPEFGEELLSYAPDLAVLGRQHLGLVAASAGAALVVGLPLGVLLSRPRFARSAEWVMQGLNIGTTVPTLAVLALSMGVLGIGRPPAIFALALATLLPIVRNTFAGLRGVPAHLLEAAAGMGMTARTSLWRVELPHAAPVIFAGVRTALTINVGTAPLASLIGGGGLGDLIFAGIQLYDPVMMLVGAVATALLALAVDAGAGLLQRLVVGRRRLRGLGHDGAAAAAVSP